MEYKQFPIKTMSICKTPLGEESRKCDLKSLLHTVSKPQMTGHLQMAVESNIEKKNG